jgi:hypothetical protein
VVVDDFNVFSAFRRPDETKSELIIDADGILALTPPGQRFKSVPWWRAKIGERDSRIKHAEFAHEDLGTVCIGAVPLAVAHPEQFAGLIPETQYHARSPDLKVIIYKI